MLRLPPSNRVVFSHVATYKDHLHTMERQW